MYKHQVEYDWCMSLLAVSSFIVTQMSKAKNLSIFFLVQNIHTDMIGQKAYYMGNLE